MHFLVSAKGCNAVTENTLDTNLHGQPQNQAGSLTLITIDLMSSHFWCHNTLITPHLNHRLADSGATKCFLNDNNFYAPVASGKNPCLAQKMESATDCAEGRRLLALAFNSGYALTTSLVSGKRTVKAFATDERLTQ